MANVVFIIFTVIICNTLNVCHSDMDDYPTISTEAPGLTTKTLMFWPNATVPFYINPHHYDPEQILTIVSALENFKYKTCLEFKLVLSEPTEHVMTFQNPQGLRKCVFDRNGHNIEEPHVVVIGYDCMQTPDIDMMIMKALGFTFEHNRASRDDYMEVLYENIEPDALYLFARDSPLPRELGQMEYDQNSVMHFDQRAFSKNGHRTIIFKKPDVRQKKEGLTENDLLKIKIVYGAECVQRDRNEKMEMCQKYPASRKKRSVEGHRRSLRANPDITPPPSIDDTERTKDESDKASKKIREYGLEDEVEEVVDKIFKVSSIAISKTKSSLCNASIAKAASVDNNDYSKPQISALVSALIVSYTDSMIRSISSNLTDFCNESAPVESYLRMRCNAYNPQNCPKNYRSTKHGMPMHSTQHRPLIRQSTKNWRLRAGSDDANVTVEETTAAVMPSLQNMEVKEVAKKERRKRDAISVIPIISTNDNSGQQKMRRMLDNRLRVTKMTRNREVNEAGFEESKDNRQSDEVVKGKHHEKTLKSQRINDKDKIMVVNLTEANLEFYNDRKWPHGIVPYIITYYVKYDINALRERMQRVNEILVQRTCVQLREIEEADVGKYEDYLVLNTSPDFITGRVGGRQDFGSIELFEGGQHRQHTAMMVMAMLGFYFEVSRHDRDKYIRVHVRHIRPDKLHHFEKIRDDATLALPYDYESATHPAWQFWRKVAQDRISTVATYKEQDPDGSVMKYLGQNRKLLSDFDIVKVNSVYGTTCLSEKDK